MADIIKIPSNITYANAPSVYQSLRKAIDVSNQPILDLGQSRLNTVTKAIIRKLHDAFPSKLVIPEPLWKEVSYPATEVPSEKTGFRLSSLLEGVGDALLSWWHAVTMFTVITVDMVFFSLQAITNRRHIVRYETLKNIYFIGYRAIPIVFLLSFLIGLVITLQAAIQMSKFGGQGFLALLIGTAMFKELGPLITAIIIAGRTGSSIAAEIGTMVVMEEVDALQTMGIKPLKFLLAPKFWAFTFSMPILTMISNLAGIGGGMVVSMSYNIPASAFISQIIEALNGSDIAFGVIKSFTFAWVILAIACFKGLHVRGGADAVGKATTDSVVASIFMVVVVDALFSLILYT